MLQRQFPAPPQVFVMFHWFPSQVAEHSPEQSTQVVVVGGGLLVVVLVVVARQDSVT